MIDFDFNKYCYGCSACSNICPKKVITMTKNNEGFLFPEIDKNNCINCDLCDKVCPYLNEEEENSIKQEDYAIAAYRKDNTKYRDYTSSGIFNAVAFKIIENGGYVCGCVWDNNMKAVHTISNDIKVIKKMSYSKYVQSDMDDIFISVQSKLSEGKNVLFCGTPCQVSAIKKFVKRNSDSLYTIAIVCHGTPSPEVWKMYKEKLETKVNSKMIDANFRHKGKYGWITPFTRYEFENGKKITNLSFTDDSYVIAFGEDMLHRNSCYRCRYKGTNNNADLVTGDYWGCPNEMLKASKNKGISSIIVHTEKGKYLLESIEEKFIYQDISIDDMIKENKPVLNPVKYNSNREVFYEKFKDNKNIDYLDITMKNKKYKIKSFLYRFHIFECIKRLIYIIKH